MKNIFFLTIAFVLVLLLALTACGGGGAVKQPAAESKPAEPAAQPAQAMKGDPAAGEKLFAGTCSACHGPKGEGIQGLGKNMTTSQFIAGKNDADLVAFIKVGRDPSDPLNTTGVAMPPKGGNPSLQDQDLYNIVAHIRTLPK